MCVLVGCQPQLRTHSGLSSFVCVRTQLRVGRLGPSAWAPPRPYNDSVPHLSRHAAENFSAMPGPPPARTRVCAGHCPNALVFAVQRTSVLCPIFARVRLQTPRAPPGDASVSATGGHVCG